MNDAFVEEFSTVLGVILIALGVSHSDTMALIIGMVALSYAAFRRRSR